MLGSENSFTLPVNEPVQGAIKLKKKCNPYLASLLSIPVPGLGQLYAGKGERGAAILIVTIIVGNLNAIWLTLHGNVSTENRVFWSEQLPRLLHDLFAAYAIIFLIWQVLDAYHQAKSSAM
jgi:TM2 domain-containing membrane protein YozV